jgi:hypothetical protein
VVDAVVASALALVLVATALFAAALVARGFTSFLLAAWLVVIAEVQAIALALSPFHAVGRPGYAICESALLGLVLAVWDRRGRPRLRRPDTRFLTEQPTLLVLGVGVAVGFGYEALLVLTLAPNNWDSLTYHLPRAAAWYQHGGIHWITNAPTERQNAFPAGSELANLWTFVAVGSDRLAAFPQLLAGPVASVGVFGIAARLGCSRPSAAFAALLVPSLALVALESSTTQNDLFVASLVLAAAYFLLGTNESTQAGFAFALALCVKLTAALAVPGLVLLALVSGISRRRTATLILSFLTAFALLGAWLYVQNLGNTGLLLGHGGGRVEHSPDLTTLGWLASVIRILYRFLDLTGVPSVGLGAAGSSLALLFVAVVVAVANRVDLGWRRAPAVVTGGAVVIGLPLLVTVVAAAAEFVLTRLHFGISPAGTSESSFSWAVSHHAHEDFSYFGPLGLVLLALVVSALRAGAVRRAPGQAVLAASFVLVIAGVAATYRFNDFVGRFTIIPVVLAAPLLAGIYRHRAVAAGTAVLALATLALTLWDDELKPATREPWSLSRAEALGLQGWQPGIAAGVQSLERAVPAHGCVDALLSGDEAAYPLFGPRLTRRVTYVQDATRARSSIVIGPGESTVSLDVRWRVTSLGGYWRLGIRRGVAAPFACHRAG